MPSCFHCRQETLATKFLLSRQYKGNEDFFAIFCSPDCLKDWLDDQEDIARFERKEPKLLTWNWEKVVELKSARTMKELFKVKIEGKEEPEEVR